MTRYLPNPLLVRFDDAIVPSEWTSKQARLLYDAAMEAEADGSWAEHAVNGSVQMALQPRPDGPNSPYGTPATVARLRAQDHIARLRREAQRLQDTLDTYGPEAFVMPLEAVRAPKHPIDAQQFLLELVRSAWSHIRISGRLFVRSPSGSVMRGA